MATEAEFDDVRVESMPTEEMALNQPVVNSLPKIIPFRGLCRCGDEVWIENDGQLYRLRRTRQGKLILTK
jgi:hemin uptake protein HemP